MLIFLQKNNAGSDTVVVSPQHLLQSLKSYDDDFENHKKWNDKLIDSVSPLNKENILKYQILLEKLGVKQ